MKSRCLFATVFLLSAMSPALAQTTAFTYQGKLSDSGLAANGNYDLRFALFDSVSGGSQIGSTQTVSPVSVTAGVFTVQLDFGASSFSGANRWLEISARPSGGLAFTPLSPRQAVSSTPYAIRSLSASSADAVTVAGLPAGSGNYIQNSNAPQSSSNFNISGNGTAGGTLSGNVVNSTTMYNLGGTRILSAASTNLFSGLFAGQANPTGFGNSFIGFQAGLFTNSGSNNSFFGDQAGRSNSTGNNNTFVGRLAGLSNDSGSANTLLGHFASVGTNNLTNATAIGASAIVNQSDSLVLGSIAGVNGANASVNVGIGTTTPQVPLDVIGTGVFRPAASPSSRATVIGNPDSETGITIRGESNRADIRFDDTTLKLVASGGVLPPPDTSGIAITTLGNVGIGTLAPSVKLEVNGNVRVNLASGGSLSMCLTGLTGVGLLAQCSSSLRYKTSVRPFIGGLDLISRLRPISFNWKDSGRADFGLAAEDVAKIEPLLVTHNEKGEIEGVKYDHLNAILINAVKQQQKQIEILQAENAALNTRLRSIEKRIRKRTRVQSR